jgi:hypothetical protein
LVNEKLKPVNVVIYSYFDPYLDGKQPSKHSVPDLPHESFCSGHGCTSEQHPDIFTAIIGQIRAIYHTI